MHCKYTLLFYFLISLLVCRGGICFPSDHGGDGAGYMPIFTDKQRGRAGFLPPAPRFTATQGDCFVWIPWSS